MIVQATMVIMQIAPVVQFAVRHSGLWCPFEGTPMVSSMSSIFNAVLLGKR